MIDVALGIDVGTSGVRVAAVSDTGEVFAMAMAPIEAPLQNTGRHLQDAALWWRALKNAFAGLDLAGLNPRALAVDGTSGTILPVGASGEPLALASMYNDLADATEVERVNAVAPADTAARGASSPLARALAMQNGTGIVRILHQADWIAGRFTGEFSVSDENNALKTGYDPRSGEWPGWIGGTGLDTSLLPRVVPAGSAIAPVSAAAAAEFSLPRDLMIIAGTTDGCAAFLASGAGESGDGVTSLGTTLTIKLLSSEPVFAPQYGIYSHRIRSEWLAGGASNTGGAVIAQYFTRDDLARLTPLIDPERPTGLDYYPLTGPGERFPVNDPAWPPHLTPRPAEDHVFLQAILEGIAAVEVRAYRRLAELGASPLRTIRTVGGGAANAAWSAIRQKALGVPSLQSSSSHAAVGTARLAWRGLRR
jgi:hypothetical protein